ncbi:MAG: DNA translocase FtsK 4TM domain-containing protein [Armatimonadota bacterium]
MSTSAARRPKPPARKPKAPEKPKTRARVKQEVVAESRGKPVVYELVAIGLITVGILLLLALYMHGWFTDHLLKCLRYLFGTYGAWVVSVAFILLGVKLLVKLSKVELPSTSLGMGILFLVAISLLQYREMQTNEFFVWNWQKAYEYPGGFFGGEIALGLTKVFGKLSWVVMFAVGLGGLSLMTDVPLWKIIAWPFRALFLTIRWLFTVRQYDEDEETADLRKDQENAARVAALQQEELRLRNRPRPEDEDKRFTPPVPEPRVLPTAAPSFMPEPAPVVDIEPDPEPVPRITGVPSKNDPEQLQFADEAVSHPSNRPYSLPPVELLTATPQSSKPKKDDSPEKIRALEATLSSFGIDAKVVEVERGPRVTRFEIVPPPGIRINRITNLADNIALSLSALDVRVEAPVPGKGVVGIEVPNLELEMVDLRAIIDSEVCRKAKSPLTFALGRDISGHPRVADLARMPHLLIAGATNSGKSVCINSLLSSILMRATPQQVKFLLVDPKRVELSLFQSIPHLIAPVAYDAKHAAGLLRWAIREMEQRYEMFAEKCVRNIAGFNEQSRLEGLEELPYIVIIIDELADLMMQAAAEFEASICRIAQLARATGIHLVVATQRPSVNVITGTIKANIPSRIAFAVASQVDSRTILDMNGAERLVGQGDMLYLPVDASKPARIQGAYVSEKDINRVVEHIKGQGKPHFTDEIVAIEEEAMRSESDAEYNDEPEDELYNKALDYVRTTKYASTSMLQRKFRIGYTRAARLMDQFEERGFVGPGQGSKPREVIFAPSASVVGRPAAGGESAGGEEELQGERYLDEE